MNKRDNEELYQSLSGFDDDDIEEIAENIQFLDSNAKERIAASAEQKIMATIKREETETKTEEIPVYHSNKISRFGGFSIAACAVLAVGLTAVMIINNKNTPLVVPDPESVASAVADTNEETEISIETAFTSISPEISVTAVSLSSINKEKEISNITEKTILVSEIYNEPDSETSVTEEYIENTATEESKTETIIETTEETVQNKEYEINEDVIRKLIDKSLECRLDVYSTPFEHDESGKSEDDWYGIYPVTDSRFSSFSDLEKYAHTIYCNDEVNALLYTGAGGENVKYFDIDGKLYVDTSQFKAVGYFVDWSSYSIEINSISEDKCTFTAICSKQEPGIAPPEEYRAEGSAVLENDGWKLVKGLR